MIQQCPVYGCEKGHPALLLSILCTLNFDTKTCFIINHVQVLKLKMTGGEP